MLVVCRGIQGVGSGGIIQLGQIIVSDITPLHDRGKYMGLFGSIWGISSVFGPLVGMLGHRLLIRKFDADDIV